MDGGHGVDILRAIPRLPYEDHPVFRDFPAAEDGGSEHCFQPLREIEDALPTLHALRGFDLSFWRPAKDRMARRHRRFAAWAGQNLEEFKSRLLASRRDWSPSEIERIGDLAEQLLIQLRYQLDALWHAFYYTDVAPFRRGRHREHLDGLAEKGYATFRLDRDERDRLRTLLAPLERTLRAADPSADSGWACAAVPLEQEAEFRGRLDACLQRFDLLGLASDYMGRSMALTAVYLHLTRPGDAWAFYRYRDMGLPEPATVGLHYDSQAGMMKSMLYLTDVGVEQGPFSVISGSARAARGTIQQLSGKAIPYAGIDLRSPETRALFMKLPRGLRNYSHFGDDLQAGSPLEQAYRAHEHVFLSSEADIILFDNYGLHRGGRTREGERLALQLHFRPVATPAPSAAAA